MTRYWVDNRKIGVHVGMWKRNPSCVKLYHKIDTKINIPNFVISRCKNTENRKLTFEFPLVNQHNFSHSPKWSLPQFVTPFGLFCVFLLLELFRNTYSSSKGLLIAASSLYFCFVKSYLTWFVPRSTTFLIGRLFGQVLDRLIFFHLATWSCIQSFRFQDWIFFSQFFFSRLFTVTISAARQSKKRTRTGCTSSVFFFYFTFQGNLT